MMGEKHDAGAHVVEITLKEQSYHNLTIQGATQENELIYNGAICDKRNAILNVKENDF